MKRVIRIVTAGAVVLGATTLGTAVGARVPTDDPPGSASLAAQRVTPDNQIERRVDALLARMTTQEKLQQVQLLSDGQITDADAKAGVGGVFSLTDPVKINHFQKVAVEQSRLHIPILFAYDTIHGYRTIFPAPLGAASSFDPSMVEDAASIWARESAVVGLKQIYSPMVDVSHEPRWGRIVEGNGEDPFLGERMAVAQVQGAQGDSYAEPDKVVTSVKHYVAYGQPEGGRDYNTTDMSENRLRNLYLPPFKAAVDAGADTVMCSFNSLNGVPGCANKHTETDILKKEWGFDGFIESDYTAVTETLNHGTAATGADAGANALMAGTDSEMVSTTIRDNGQQLLSQGRITMSRLDDAVRRILRVKFRAGLFEHPYVDQAKAADESSFLTPGDRAAARRAGSRSTVLLKNDGATLPFSASKKTVVIGPLGRSGHDMLGPWWGRGRDEDAVDLVTGLKAQNPDTTYVEGCKLNHDEPPQAKADDSCYDADIAAVTAAARSADQVVLALGENREMSAEAAARVDIDLPGDGQKIIDAVKATGKPFVVVLFNGRPLTLEPVAAASPAILEAWFPGVEAGNSLADVLFGKVNPGGKLPVTFPRRLGQVPIYYNHEPTGRPCDVTQKYVSRYRDLDSCDPLYPFGFGLSYTTFSVSGLTLNKDEVKQDGKLMASATVTNTGTRAGDEVVQLYLHDPVASLSQPVRRLRGFERVTLQPGESKKVTFTLGRDDYGFYDNGGKYVVEPGAMEVYVGDSSTATMRKTFTITR